MTLSISNRTLPRTGKPGRMGRQTASVTVVLVLAAAAQAGARSDAAPSRFATPESESVVRIVVPDESALEQLVATGTDLAEYRMQTSAGIEVIAVVTPSESAALRERGFIQIGTVAAEKDVTARRIERTAALEIEQRAAAGPDTITIDRALRFASQGQSFLSVRATSSAAAAPGVALTATWRDRGGSSGTVALDPRTDAGVYLGHEARVPVPLDPILVTVESSLGGRASGRVTEWLRRRIKPPGPHYVDGFVGHYMDPTEIDARIQSLALEFPNLATLVELPHLTNGYRRHAQAVLGTPPAAAVVVTSRAWGHEGGNDLAIDAMVSGPNQALAIEVGAHDITVRLASDAAGNPISTALEVAEAINQQASDIISASTYRGDPGAGVMDAEGPIALSDYLNAPPTVSREPFQVRALRIGLHRDGSKTGVLAYAQEHAREWVTPLVAIEAAERLLRNYAHDQGTRRLLNSLDIFIIPSVNPDGAHFSFYDFAMQRKSMRNYCDTTQSDPGLRNSWGVDINRNYREGSIFDGYSGASADCQSEVYAGPGELSEPESKNVIWLAENFPNIDFAVNVHSFGGYVMRPPGAYQFVDRVLLPAPSAQEENSFWRMSERVERGVKSERGTVVWPERTGAVADVLYSAAGNSMDHLWYERGIQSLIFEVGNDIWDSGSGQWVPVGFQPPFNPEGRDEAMEYATGLIELLRIASSQRGG